MVIRGDDPAVPGEPAAHDETGLRRGSDDSGVMIRSEEQLRVRTESYPVERVRVRKYVVTEHRTITVPLRREEIRVERVPVDAIDPGDDEVLAPASGAVPGAAGSDDEQVIILHAERPVVTTEVVPVERVRLGKRTVTEHETVGGEVRREKLELDMDPTDAEGR